MLPWGKNPWELRNAARWLCLCPQQCWSGAGEKQSASWSDVVSLHHPHTPVSGSTQTCSVAQLKAYRHDFMLFLYVPHTSVSRSAQTWSAEQLKVHRCIDPSTPVTESTQTCSVTQLKAYKRMILCCFSMFPTLQFLGPHRHELLISWKYADAFTPALQFLDQHRHVLSQSWKYLS